MARILIVEDDRTFATVLAQTLELAGHDVSTTEDAAEGIRRGLLDPPDVVIAAWRLKGDVHGGDVCRRICTVGPDVKAIVTAAHQEHAVEAAHYCRCIEGVLVKPFHKSEILDAVRRATSDVASPEMRLLPIPPLEEQGSSYQLLTHR
jgi:DNA-binding NtrC family response regulator